MNLPLNQIVCGDAFQVLKDFPEESIDLAMFSPPYWGLRDYKIPKVDDVFAVGGLGLESHPKLYIERMRVLCGLLKRVLKKSGSLWLNMGDTYYAQRSEGIDFETSHGKTSTIGKMPQLHAGGAFKSNWLQPKQKLLIPERVAIALQDDGWILRNDIVWHKPNHMPSSVKDRLTTSWEHLYFFVKSKRYYFDLDAIRQPHKFGSQPFNYRVRDAEQSEKFGSPRARNERKQPPRLDAPQRWERGKNVWEERFNEHGKNPSDTIITRNIDPNKDYKTRDPERHVNLLGKNPDDVWTEILEERSRQGGAQRQAYEFWLKWKQQHPNGTYEEFYNEVASQNLSKWQNEKWQVDIDDKQTSWGNFARYLHLPHPKGSSPQDFWSITTQPFKDAHFAVYPERLCEMPIKAGSPKDGIVLDPMCGSGTTLLVARKLCRNYIGIELNLDYVKMALKRLTQIPQRIDTIIGA